MILQNLSWTHYLTIIACFSIVYYGFVLLRYYVPQWKTPSKPAAAVNSLFQAAAGPEEMVEETDDSIDEIDDLIADIKKRAATMGQEPAPLATLRQHFKNILQAHRGLKDSPHRPAINELIVSECKKHGQALLSEAEVDLWWVHNNPLANPPGPAPLPEGWPR